MLVHDAARPLVPEEVIERVLTALDEGWDGAVPALPARGHGQARRRRRGSSRRSTARVSSPCRRRRRSSPRSCGRAVGSGGAKATDCAALVEAAGGRVRVVAGRPAAAQGHGARRPRARRRAGCDRRLPHASPRARTSRSTTRSTAGRALRRGRARERGVDEIGFTRARLLLRADAPLWTCRTRPSAAPTTSSRTSTRSSRPSARAAGEARARGRLGARTARMRRGDCSLRTRGTTCSARSTSSTGSRSTASRASSTRVGVDEAWRRYFETLAERRASGLFDVLAHPDLVKIFGDRAARLATGRTVAALADRRRARGLDGGPPQAARQALSRRGLARRLPRARASRSRSPRTRTRPNRRPRLRPGARARPRGRLRDRDGLRRREARQEPLG